MKSKGGFIFGMFSRQEFIALSGVSTAKCVKQRVQHVGLLLIPTSFLWFILLCPLYLGLEINELEPI
jgi:hypothetical protein